MPNGLAPLASKTIREGFVEAGSGRILQWREQGDLQGVAVFILHGTPGCRQVFGPFVDDAVAKGVRIISYDRPGYGGSTPHPGRAIGDSALEVSAIADSLGIDRFGVWGFSGGGAAALAVAALVPDRVAGAASLAAIAPFQAKGLDWFAGMGEANAADYRLLIRDRRTWEEKSRSDLEMLRNADPQQIQQIWRSLLSPVDGEVVNAEFAATMHSQFREAFSQGAEGMMEDNLAQVSPWKFEIDSIHVPVQIWHGQQDWFVPFGHGVWLAAHVPGAEAHLEPALGHVSLLRKAVPQMHAWLGSKLRGTSGHATGRLRNRPRSR